MLRKWKCLFLFLFVSLLFSAVNCESEEDTSVDDLADDCCVEGESWLSTDCEPPPDPDRTEGCVKSGKECCKKAKEKEDSCQKGIEVAKETNSCDSVEEQEEASCCNTCTIGMTLSLGSSGGCGSEDLSSPLYTCCMKQEATTTTEQPSTTPFPESTTIRNYNQPALNPCEMEGDDLCAHKCIPTGASYKCTCKSGYKLWTDNHSCRKMDVNRCQRKNPCDHKCTDTGDAIVCSCRRGFELMADNVSCIDLDECALQIHSCKEGQKCVNTAGSYSCVAGDRVEPRSSQPNKPKRNCPAGFVFNDLNQVCDDDDECKRNPCPPGLSCVNSIGSFSCGFAPGVPVPPPPPVAVAQPSPALAPRAPIDPDSDVICPPGFRLNEELGECKDIDECVEGKDDCNRMSQICLNTHGTFTCHNKASKLTCPAGFKMNEKFECEDIDECYENPDLCTPDSICVNEPGSYDCKSRSSLRQIPVPAARPVQQPARPTPQPIQPSRPQQSARPTSPFSIPRRPNFPQSCPKGYRKADNGGCADIDECLENTHTCDDFQDCQNIMGGHRCTCKKGFQRDPITQACIDINECQRDELNDCTESQRCDNTVGSYHCIRYISCGTGYTLNSLSGTCEDDNECLLGTHGCNHLGPLYECLNLPGTYRCIRRSPPTTTTTTSTTQTPVYDYDSSEYYPDIEDPNTKVEETQKPSPQPGRNNVITQPRPIPPPVPPTPSRPTYTRPVQPTPEPTRPTEQPRRQEVTSERQEPPIQRPYEEPRRPYEEPRRPYIELQRPDEIPRKEIPDDRYSEEPKENNSIEDGITTTPPPATKSFRYTPDPAREERPYDPNTYRPSVDSNERRRPDEYDNRELPKVYYPKPKHYRPDEPKYATVPEPKERPVTLVGDPDTQGNIVLNTNDLKENTWTKLVPGSKRCQSGFAMDTKGECIDIDECKTGRNRCDPNNEVCFNTPGDYKCICAPGYFKDGASERCRRKDDLYPPPNPGGIQPVWAPGPKKVCDIGFHVDPSTNECADIDECSDGTSRCATNEQCINTLGGFRCQCSPGFVLSAGRCVPPQIPTPSRPRQQTPVVRVTSPPRHNFCTWGYRFENNRCVDVDECATETNNCLPNQHCVNIPGGYLCHCAPGHRLVSDGGCEDVDECKESAGKVCSQYATCVNTIGSFECKCRSGFATSPMSKQLCNDVDECQENAGLGPCHQKCVNIWGSYRCACQPGYKLNQDNRTCSDIDECSEHDRRLCVGTCENIPGSYQCTCPRGYRRGLDKRSCIDIDECETGELVCGAEELCQNIRGGARCRSMSCPAGYFRDPKSRHRCRRTGICNIRDYNCLRQPETYSFNFITFVSKLYIPNGPRPQVDLFTMKGSNWSENMLDFKMRFIDVTAPPGLIPADVSNFKLTLSPNQAIISLVKTLTGPQDIHLELAMDVYRPGGFYEGAAVAKVFIYVSEFEF